MEIKVIDINNISRSSNDLRDLYINSADENELVYRKEDGTLVPIGSAGPTPNLQTVCDVGSTAVGLTSALSMNSSFVSAFALVGDFTASLVMAPGTTALASESPLEISSDSSVNIEAGSAITISCLTFNLELEAGTIELTSNSIVLADLPEDTTGIQMVTRNGFNQLRETALNNALAASFIEADSGITGDNTGTWVIRSVGLAFADTLISVSMQKTGGGGTDTMGVRAIGSSLNRTYQQDNNGYCYLQVKTNFSGSFEIFSDNNNVDFTMTASN